MAIRIPVISSLVMLAGALLLGPVSAQDKPAEKLKVVTTFSILADITRNVGGERVEVVSLVGPNADAHVFSPTPADVRTVGEARVLVTNGLGYEGWLARLVNASKGKATTVAATDGIKARRSGGHSHGHNHSHGHSHGERDPHAWQSVTNVKTYATNIRNALVKADPAGKADYDANTATYLAKLDALDKEIREAVSRIPKERRRVITGHDAFGYFKDAYGVDFIAPRGMSTESQPSAGDVAKIIAQVKRQKIPAVFLENITDQRLINRIAEESGAKIGGQLISDALTDDKGEAPTYIDMMRHNVKQLVAALGD